MRTHARLAKWLVAALTLALSITFLVVPPAQAGWTDSGPGGSGGSGGNTGSQGSNGEYHCGNWLPGQNAGALYRKLGAAWYRWYEYGYSSCVGQGASTQWNNTGYQELCPTGFLVYRFYGSFNNPAAAVTRSQTNQESWCSGESTYAFPAANPLDAGVDVGSPWKAALGVNMNQLNNGAPSVHYMRNDAGLLVPSWSTRVQGQCSDLQSEGALRSWFNNTASDTERIAMRAALGYDYWIASGEGRYSATGLAEAGLSSAHGYRFSWENWLRNTNAVPAYDPNGNAYYLTDFAWETRPCASPFQFMSTTKAAPTDRTVIGTCYIPTVRKRQQLVNVRSGQLGWKWPSLQHSVNLGWGDGERMSQFYAGTEFTPRGPGGDSLDSATTGLSADQQIHLITGWRNAMVNDYRAWAGQGVTNSQGAQVVPVNPYRGESDRSLLGAATAVDINAAVDALYWGARCRVGSSVQFDVPEPQDAPEVNGAVNLAMSNVEVLQVSPTEAQIKVNAATMLCGGQACPSNVSLKSLYWDANMVGQGGFKLCSASSTKNIPAGCDGVVATKSVSSGGIKRSQTFTVRFANPTDPKEAVGIDLTRLGGEYTQIIKTSGLQIRGVSPITGASYTIDTGPLEAKITKPLAVTASGKPVALTRTAAGYTAKFPVIGAIQVPVNR